MSMEEIERRGEGGQALILAVLVMAVLLGFTAMAIDVGLLFENRRHLQNSADAMALAGVQELPVDPLAAKQKAKDWAANNGIAPAEIKSIEVRTKSFPNDTLAVELTQNFNWIFARALGKTSSSVSSRAVARTGSLLGGHQTMPWALLMGDTPCLDPAGNPLYGISCSVKVGAGSSAIDGWYGALDFDGIGGGSAEYESNIVDGTTDTAYCIVGSPMPPCQSSTITALDGNKTGGTDQGITTRELVPQCDANGNGKDDFTEVFLPNVGVPPYFVVCPDSPWLIIIPIVSYDSIPVKNVTIQGWALAYLEGYKCVDNTGPLPLSPIAKPPKPTPTPTPAPTPPGATPTPTPAPVPNGNCSAGKGHWEVQIRMVDAAYSEGDGFLGDYNPAGIKIRRLVE